MHDYGFCVNQCQSPVQRRFKYQLLKMFDLPSCESRRLRDWNWSKILGYVARIKPENIEPISELINIGYDMFHDEILEAERNYHLWSKG